MFRIKICGITNVEDARVVARAGADAVGLNFYPRSPRYVTPQKARLILDELPEGLLKVGLFVNASVDDVSRTFDRLGLGLIQLHGNEPPEFLAQLSGRPVLRAFRVGPEGLYPMTDYLQRCSNLGCVPRMVLADADVPGVYGGTGRLADWEVFQQYPAEQWFPPLVLAGGLTPQNVVEAIGTVRPAAVDAASGVESSPGRKDPVVVAAFVRAARMAFNDV